MRVFRNLENLRPDDCTFFVLPISSRLRLIRLFASKHLVLPGQVSISMGKSDGFCLTRVAWFGCQTATSRGQVWWRWNGKLNLASTLGLMIDSDGC